MIFNHTLEEQVQHSGQLFMLLRSENITLAPTKSYLGYPSLMLLGQRVDSLGMTTAEEKIRAITALKVPSSLRELETFLGLTGWLRSSIPWYAQRAQALQDRTEVSNPVTRKAGQIIRRGSRSLNLAITDILLLSLCPNHLGYISCVSLYSL